MRNVVATAAVLCVAAAMELLGAAPVWAAKPVPDRVVVMYFHRTQRCPTCLKMGTYAEEAVKSGFATQMKDGKVEFHLIDFQNAKNAVLTKGYKVSGPTLIVAKVVGDKVKEHKALTEMWEKVRDKEAFIKYVQGAVKEYLPAKK